MTMRLKEVVSTKHREAFLREYTDSPLEAGQVRIGVDFASAKHGTEFVAFRGMDPHLDNRFDGELQLFLPDLKAKDALFFMRPGNMYVGKVTELGKEVKNLRTGDRVAWYGSLRQTQTAHADSVLVMPERMTWKEAVCYDPAHFALGGIRDGQVRLGDCVVIFGLGAIGMLAAQMAKLAGASLVIVCDPIEKRRTAAVENGADIAIDSANEDAGLKIKEMTCKRGADVIIETSGSYQALQAAIRGIAYSCNIAVVGWYHECRGGLDFGREAHFNRPNLIFSRACSEPNPLYPNWDFKRLQDACWDMLARGLLKCENIVDPVVPFEESAKAYMAIEQNPVDSIKLGVSF